MKYYHKLGDEMRDYLVFASGLCAWGRERAGHFHGPKAAYRLVIKTIWDDVLAHQTNNVCILKSLQYRIIDAERFTYR